MLSHFAVEQWGIVGDDCSDGSDAGRDFTYLPKGAKFAFPAFFVLQTSFWCFIPRQPAFSLMFL